MRRALKIPARRCAFGDDMTFPSAVRRQFHFLIRPKTPDKTKRGEPINTVSPLFA
jgi:hypothetical protein